MCIHAYVYRYRYACTSCNKLADMNVEIGLGFPKIRIDYIGGQLVDNSHVLNINSNMFKLLVSRLKIEHFPGAMYPKLRAIFKTQHLPEPTTLYF